MLNNNYMASLQYIYKEISKYRKLTGKTPFKTIQERVQRDPTFSRIGLGLYALTTYLDKIDRASQREPQKETKEYVHTEIQSILLEIGEAKEYGTYTPDKTKTFNGKPLGSISSIKICPAFTYKHIINETARYIDVIWFNQRAFPARLFEVESSTNFRNAFIKFSELQDFHAKFIVVAPQIKQQQYEREIRKRTFENIASRCEFKSFESIRDYYQKLLSYVKVKALL